MTTDATDLPTDGWEEWDNIYAITITDDDIRFSTDATYIAKCPECEERISSGDMDILSHRFTIHLNSHE